MRIRFWMAGIVSLFSLLLVLPYGGLCFECRCRKYDEAQTLH